MMHLLAGTMTQQEKTLRDSIRELRKEMKARGIKRTSCFNGGLDTLTYQYNARMFRLQTELQKTNRKLLTAILQERN